MGESAIKQFWIGKYEACIKAAMERGVKNPKIIFKLDHVAGLRGPMVVYLCHGYRECSDLRQILNWLNLARRGSDIRIQRIE